ncbi:LysR family transcriptional regulator [Roseibium sp.]|uniref:LysR family transcriptional regulator n=1 Tax=Roseibium sp. TaxID=1936156 RepID=UPI003A97E9B3
MRNLQVYRYVDAIARTGSIRKAAEQLAITPSALNRRILALEEELDAPIFERLGRGVRLSTAGELLIDMFRKQLAEADLVKSRIADLTGLRRGHVTVTCSQAVLPHFLPEQVRLYQQSFPDVTFSIQNKDGEDAEEALRNHAVDLAVVFEPLSNSDFQTLASVPQPIHALMAADHPLANNETLKFSDCLAYPLALPSKTYAVRQILRAYSDRLAVRLSPSIEAESYIFLRNFVAHSQAIAFELEIGVRAKALNNNVKSIPLSVSPGSYGSLYVAQLKERTLPVASARFAQQLVEVLENSSFGDTSLDG